MSCFDYVDISPVKDKHVDVFISRLSLDTLSPSYCLLSGSEKQVAWADALRKKCMGSFLIALKELVRFYLAERLKVGSGPSENDYRSFHSYCAHTIQTLSSMSNPGWFITHRQANEKNILKLLYRDFGLGDEIAPVLFHYFAYCGFLG